MTRNPLAAVCVLFLFATPLAAQNDPPAQQPSKEIRKLNRRERKERISKLSEAYRQFLEEVQPIMQETELDTFLILETDPQREIYIKEFWRRRDLASGISNFAFKDAYYLRLEHAREQYKQLSSDRARIFLLHGEPMDVLKVECDSLLQPIEIWRYFEIPQFGHDIRFLFYVPRHSRDYKLWRPMGDPKMDLAELVSVEAAGGKMGDDAVRDVFFESATGPGMGIFISKIELQCKQGEEILRAINQQQQNRVHLMAVFEPPKVNEEDVRKILRSVVISDPNAPKLSADFSVRYPAKQGSRTDAEITVLIPRSQLAAKEVGGVTVLSVDVTGEVLRDQQLYENYRYRFDFPADIKDEKVPIVLDRFLRPGEYRSRIKVSDPHSGAEAVFENDLSVPEIFDTAEQKKQKESAASTVAQLKDDIESAETRLRIVPLPDELLSGIQKIETLAVGPDIAGVEFFLDGKKIAVKRQPPFTLDLDFGTVPQLRKIRAIAIDAKGLPLAGDDIVVNTGNDPFRVRIVSPRVGNIRGKTRVEMSVKAPEGKAVQQVELYLNETKMATLFDAPFVQTILIPHTQGVGYLRAVATLKDDPAPVEDVVMINSPAQMEQIEVHLIELPTTVLMRGRPVNNLVEDAFKVLDQGKPVKISKFEHVKNLSLSIGLAIDTSGSMLPRMNEAQKAAAQFFQNVMKPGDKAFVVGFDSQPQLVQKWSRQMGDLHAGLAKLRAEDYTALYDAVVFSLYNFLGIKGQKALVLLSDGKDTASKFSFDQVLEYSRRAGVPIYVIGLGIRQTEVDVRNKLGKLAMETGGNVYYIERAEDLGKTYSDIQNELRSQYVLGFYPPEGVKAGSKWREVSVQVSDGKAKTIRGYYP
ncbi:MAG: VWA domain-containing protein [Thermoanaerobaculia bacterium]|nr:VWA domain-containing protein [Thermoanaerobaculia bacterium]